MITLEENVITISKNVINFHTGGRKMSVSVLVLTPEVKTALDAGFLSVFGTQPERYFSAPGRTEVSGNHTDHQRGWLPMAVRSLFLIIRPLVRSLLFPFLPGR